MPAVWINSLEKISAILLMKAVSAGYDIDHIVHKPGRANKAWLDTADHSRRLEYRVMS
jgi:hypothetical protein